MVCICVCVGHTYESPAGKCNIWQQFSSVVYEFVKAAERGVNSESVCYESAVVCMVVWWIRVSAVNVFLLLPYMSRISVFLQVLLVIAKRGVGCFGVLHKPQALNAVLLLTILV